MDLIMWKDVSRSASVFSIGTFIIISSSYARDINLRLEVYSKKSLSFTAPKLKFFCPSLLFAVLFLQLAVLARCGSLITIWKMAKFGNLFSNCTA
jgi:hypothetical protein